MKTTATLTVSALLALSALFSSPAVAEGYDIRLQAQRAMESIAQDQRQALRDGSVGILRDQAQQVASLDAPWNRDFVSGEATKASGDLVTAPTVAAPVAAPEQPRPTVRGSKFGLPYFSFGRLTSSRTDK